jgi:hypothetical protein
MQVCNPDCVTTIPKTHKFNGCNITTRKGGIARLTFLKCVPNLVFPFAPAAGETNPWTNLDNVKWAICNDILFVTGKILGQKPKGSFNKKRLSSCEPEEIVSGVKTITGADYNAASDNSLLEYDLWDSVMKNKRFLNVGWITCGDLWYQYPGAWDLEADDVQEQTNDDNTFFDFTITMNTKDIIKPIVVPGLLALLNSFTDQTCYE